MASTPAAPRVVHVECPQTAVPGRAVEPGRTRHIAVAAPPLPAATLQQRVRVVLYYRADADGGAAAPPLWEEAMWAKESLSEALADCPEMAGRLRRRADGSWDVKLNDAGIRFMNATTEATLEEFLVATADKGRRARWEAALAPWIDVNAEDPDLCALLYVQMTRFQGDGGFAIGVSCSLLLSDPLELVRFLLSWARSHSETKAQNKLATNPLMQYACYFQRPDARAVRTLIKTVPLDDSFADTDDHRNTETVIFRAKGARVPDHRALAGVCVVRASERLRTVEKAPSRFSVIVGDGKGGIRIEAACTEDEQPGSGGGGQYKLQAVQWKELGLEELVLRDSKPVHVSYSILTSGDEGLAVVMPDSAAGDFLVAAAVAK